MKFWFRCIPLTLGVILSLASTLFMIFFTRNISLDPSYFEIHPEGWVSLGLSFALAFIGVPLTVWGIKLLEEKNI